LCFVVPFEFGGLSHEQIKQLGNGSIIDDKFPIEIAKSDELSNILWCFGNWPFFDSFEFDWIHLD
jgi:hypothetical protein